VIWAYIYIVRVSCLPFSFYLRFPNIYSRLEKSAVTLHTFLSYYRCSCFSLRSLTFFALLQSTSLLPCVFDFNLSFGTSLFLSTSTGTPNLLVILLTKKTPWFESASELYRPNDRGLSVKGLPTFADRGCHVVSATDPYGRILDFLDSSRYFFIK
jgi:hypothetical protein